jgi:serpin B
MTDIINYIPADEVLSPLCIKYALYLLSLGANGETKQEIMNYLGNEYSSEDFADMNFANYFAINDKYRLRNSYIEKISSLAKVKAAPFDERLIKSINDFVEKETHGLIKKIISSRDLSDETMSIMVNVLYFKSRWNREFLVGKEENFTKTDGCKVKVPMMYRGEGICYYKEDEKNQYLEIPYEDKRFALGVILPRSSGKLPKISIADIQKLSLKKQRVYIRLPKFHQETKVDLVPILKDLGVKKIFTRSAELAGIAEQLQIQKMYQKVVITVDENGTEATAANVTLHSRNCVSEKPIEFIANHSFLYYIVHIESGEILFLGKFDGQ